MPEVSWIAAWLLCISTLVGAERGESRIVHFPKDRAVGRLMTRDIGLEKDAGRRLLSLSGWELLGQAQGDITIPAGKVLRLEVYTDATDISFISELKPEDLQVLSLKRTNILDEDFAHLKELTGLRALDLSSTKQVEGSGLAHLINLNSVKELSCFNTQISDTALEHISHLQALEYLSLYWTQVKGSGLIHLANLTSLRDLNLAKTPITDESLAHLQDMTWLRELALYDTEISDKGLAHLKRLSSLEKLTLGKWDSRPERSPITDKGLAHLKGLTALRDLRLFWTRITDADLAHLSGLTALEGLNLAGTKITGEGLAFLSERSPLRWIGLSQTNAAGPGLANLKKWAATLQDLQLRETKISDGDLVQLAGLTTLKYLQLSNTGVTDAGLAHLAGLRSLEVLQLDGTQITDAGLAHLKGLANLRNIGVSGTKVTRAGLEDFKQTSASRSVKANVGRMIVTTKEGGAMVVERELPQPEAEPPSLVGKPLPELEELKVELSASDTEDKMILVCFWDMNQRPSRHCIRELAKQVEQFKQKGVTVVAVQAFKVDESALKGWGKDNRFPFVVGMLQDDAEKIRFAWGVRSLPWLLLTDRNHVVTAEGFAVSEMGDKLE